eukprot:2595103-Rhodomonas_salina.1
MSNVTISKLKYKICPQATTSHTDHDDACQVLIFERFNPCHAFSLIHCFHEIELSNSCIGALQELSKFFSSLHWNVLANLSAKEKQACTDCDFHIGCSGSGNLCCISSPVCVDGNQQLQ